MVVLSYLEIYFHYCFLNIHMWIPLSIYLFAFVLYCYGVCVCVCLCLCVWFLHHPVCLRSLIPNWFSFACYCHQFWLPISLIAVVWVLSKNASICLELLLQLLLPMHDTFTKNNHQSINSTSRWSHCFLSVPFALLISSHVCECVCLCFDYCWPLLKAACMLALATLRKTELHVTLYSIPFVPFPPPLLIFFFFEFYSILKYNCTSDFCCTRH